MLDEMIIYSVDYRSVLSEIGGPIFGGMLLSDEKVASLIAEELRGLK